MDPGGEKNKRTTPSLSTTFTFNEEEEESHYILLLYPFNLFFFTIAFLFSFGSPIRPTERRGLPLDETLLAEKLSLLGYNTVAVGKWHLGMSQPQYLPEQRGFERFYGMVSMCVMWYL